VGPFTEAMSIAVDDLPNRIGQAEVIPLADAIALLET
jgi:hypothetical protein